MKKTILTIIAILSLWVASANVNDRTINTSVWPVLLTDYTIQYGLRTQKVGCYNPRVMCYTASEMNRVFYMDIAKVEKNYIDITGKQPVWKYLNNTTR